MVSKTSLLVKLNLKKIKSRIIVVFLFLILSSALLNLSFALQLDYDQNYYRYQKSLNASSFELIYLDSSGNNKESLEASLINNEIISNYEINDVITVNGECDFGDGTLLNYLTFFPYDTLSNKKMNQFEIIEEDLSITDGVYISYIFKSSGNYKIGDQINIRFNKIEYSPKICGFYNNITTGSMNCSDISIIIPNDYFNKLRIISPKFYKVSINNKECFDLQNVYTSIVESTNNANPNLVLVENANINFVHSSRYTNATLFKAIFLVSSIIVVIILLITISIILSNYIRNSITNFGALKALGYSSSSLISPILLEFGILSIFSSILGIFISYFIFPLINNALESQIGIPYSIHFLFIPAVLSVFVCFFVVILTSYLSIKKIKTIEPINAIKSRKINSKQTKNSLPLNKTNLKINTVLGLKSCLSSVSRNIIIIICNMAVSFLIGFSVFVYRNIVQNGQEIVELICGQVPDSVITVSGDNKDELISGLSTNNDVYSFYCCTTKKTVPSQLNYINIYIVDKTEYINSDNTLLEGSFPSNENEIAINKHYCDDNNLSLTDTVVFKSDDIDYSYKIVGIIQGAYHSGNDCFMLLEGYNRMSSLDEYQYYIALKESANIDDFNKYISDNYSIKSYLNYASYTDALIKSYKGLLVILSIVIISIAAIVSALVLYILISLLLENKRREYGILKSLGFQTRNIIYQIILSIIPFSVLASFVGLFLSKKYSGKLIVSLLNSLGIFRFGREISFMDATLCFVGITLFSIVYTIIQSQEIKRIAPRELFNRE